MSRPPSVTRAIPSPPSPDAVRAELHAFLDRLLDLAFPAAQPPEPPPAAVLPLTTAAQRLGWTRGRLRSFCINYGVAVCGRGRTAAVVWAELEAALAGQPRVQHDAPSRAEDDDMKAFLKGSG